MIVNHVNNTLSDVDRELILNQFPDEIKEQIKNVNNPLNQTEILINLFNNKNVIIVIENLSIDQSYDYVSYYHVTDLCQLLNVNKTHYNAWKTNWEINFIQYKNLSSKNNIFLINPTNKSIHPQTLFVDEEDLKKILIKVSSPEAKTFHSWILQQAKICKTIINKLIQFKNEQNQKKIENLQSKISDLESQLDHEQLYERMQIALSIMPKKKREFGVIYIGSTKEMIKLKIFKIGLSNNSDRRSKELTVGNPTFKLYMEFECEDIHLAEDYIHLFLSNIQTYKGKEFYYLPSLEIGGNVVQTIVNFVNEITKKYGDLDVILRKDLIQNNFGNIIEYVNNNRENVKTDKIKCDKWYININKLIESDFSDINRNLITVGRDK